MTGKIKVDFIVIGTLKEKGLKLLEEEYLKRLSKYAKVELKEIKEFNTKDVKQDLKKETEALKKAIDPSSFIILLDLNQKQYTSEEFSKRIDEISVYHNSKITFVIGSSNGLSDEIRELSQEKISFSQMTFPHQLFRVMLLEQVYRGFTILGNTPYHK